MDSAQVLLLVREADDLRAAVALLEVRANALERSRISLIAGSDSMVWEGPHAERFRSEVRDAAPILAREIQRLREICAVMVGQMQSRLVAASALQAQPLGAIQGASPTLQGSSPTLQGSSPRPEDA